MLALISENYRRLNAQLHDDLPEYGTGSARHAEHVCSVAAKYRARTILDYGCGKGALRKKLGGFDVREYDPAIPGKDEAPNPADLVVCSDVLEHVEPDLIENVFDDLKRLSRKAVFLVISTTPSKKTLADGRNAHLIVKSHDWWLPKITSRFTLEYFQRGGDVGFAAVGSVR